MYIFLQHGLEKNKLPPGCIIQNKYNREYDLSIGNLTDMAFLFRRFSEDGIFHSQVEASREMYMENYHFVGVKR